MSSKKIKHARKKKQAQEPVLFDAADMEPREIAKVPDNQLQLTEEELKEEFTKSLMAVNPNTSNKLTFFNFKKGTFESTTNEEHIANHFGLTGYLPTKYVFVRVCGCVSVTVQPQLLVLNFVFVFKMKKTHNINKKTVKYLT